ncbi:alpha/beta hydrolase fold domain-containing protein [Rathayibacter sp. VKM Ac-2803]|uniref:alpha/beta hydrolase n=1 Tax=unclassified Rathayibacter TaxID=2609250 RepID=UPI00135C75F9|nr:MULTISPECIES: alpha/beta hydrolase [unclassified Rathayibacter]MWV51233.1 alpha/beta hydrolase fold domain-containing protein [Rathayibacter sp. VKM Ac-2803]MWV57717.1 alpha/beta hydrolase fold domain-containing protein [Rathayibacter sp. VKM Ac-2754]
MTSVLGAARWPSALAIRAVFEREARRTAAGMRRRAPEGVSRVAEVIPGRPGAPATTADVFRSAGAGARPTVVWIHGGAWISGHRRDVDPYLRLLADAGYTTVGLDYGRGPESIYPTAPRQLLAALEHLRRHAGRLGIARDRIVLAGDSAGAQLASQLATAVTNPSYARDAGLTTSLPVDAVRAVVLHCGVFDLSSMAKVTGVAGWGFRSALWAYTGHRNWSESTAGAQMSTIDHVTPRFPPVFISGGNADALTARQSRPFAAHLRSLGVPVTELFWGAGHEAQLGHEYQFDLDLADARTALERTLAFLERVTAR